MRPAPDPGVQAPTGDPAALSAAASWHDGAGDFFSGIADQVEYTAGSLTGANWDGEAARSYAVLASYTAAHFRTAGMTARAAAAALHRFAGSLETLQAQGVRAVDQVVHWMQQLERDQTKLTAAQQAVAQAQASVQHAQQMLSGNAVPGGAMMAAAHALGPAQAALAQAQAAERAAQQAVQNDQDLIRSWQAQAREIWQEAQNEAATATGSLEPLEVTPPPLAGAPATFVDALAADQAYIDANPQLAQSLANRLAGNNSYARQHLDQALLGGQPIDQVPLQAPHHSGGGGWLTGLAIAGAVGLTEVIGGGPEDPLADLASGAEAEAIDGASSAAADSAAADGAAGDGISIEMRYKGGWTDSQIQQADAKVQQLDQAAQRGETQVTRNYQRQGSSASSVFQKAGGEVPPGYDVDHIIDLQVGGADSTSNMAPLDSSVNRSLGAQIQQAIKDLEDGTPINRFRIGGK